MQVDDQIRNCTAFVGTGLAHNFVAHGTGFFVFLQEDGFLFDYFISAQHLIWPRRKKTLQPPDTPMAIRVNTKEGAAAVLQAPPKDWFYPEDPTIDVCALRDPIELYRNPPDKYDVGSINLQNMVVDAGNAKQLGLSLGDEVFISGAFVGRVGYKKNIPIIRIANIAAMPEEPIDFASPKRPAYLIETRSLGGTSGSPVFLNTQDRRMPGSATETGVDQSIKEEERRTHFIMPYFLLGMIIFTHGGNYAPDFVSEDDTDVHPLKDVEFNAGISVALPVSAITELLNSDRVAEPRMKELEEKRRKSGARPASAAPSTATDGEGNPRHKADFDRLLNKAATTKED